MYIYIYIDIQHITGTCGAVGNLELYVPVHKAFYIGFHLGLRLAYRVGYCLKIAVIALGLEKGRGGRTPFPFPQIPTANGPLLQFNCAPA